MQTRTVTFDYHHATDGDTRVIDVDATFEVVPACADWGAEAGLEELKAYDRETGDEVDFEALPEAVRAAVTDQAYDRLWW